MIAFIGDPIKLTAMVRKNGFIYTGQIVTVEVKNESTGAILLPTTVIPETANPGQYSFLWENPPAVEQSVIAEYKVDSEIKVEAIQITSDIAKLVRFGQEIDFEVEPDPADTEIELISSENEEVNVFITPEPEIVLEIEDSGGEFDTEIASVDDGFSVLFESED